MYAKGSSLRPAQCSTHQRRQHHYLVVDHRPGAADHHAERARHLTLARFNQVLDGRGFQCLAHVLKASFGPGHVWKAELDLVVGMSSGSEGELEKPRAFLTIRDDEPPGRPRLVSR